MTRAISKNRSPSQHNLLIPKRWRYPKKEKKVVNQSHPLMSEGPWSLRYEDTMQYRELGLCVRQLMRDQLRFVQPAEWHWIYEYKRDLIDVCSFYKPCCGVRRWKLLRQPIQRWSRGTLGWQHRMSSPNCFSTPECCRSTALVSVPVRRRDEILSFSQPEMTFLFSSFVAMLSWLRYDDGLWWCYSVSVRCGHTTTTRRRRRITVSQKPCKVKHVKQPEIKLWEFMAITR